MKKNCNRDISNLLQQETVDKSAFFEKNPVKPQTKTSQKSVKIATEGCKHRHFFVTNRRKTKLFLNYNHFPIVFLLHICYNILIMITK